MGRPAHTTRLELKVPDADNADLIAIAEKIEPGGRNLLGLKLLQSALEMLRDKNYRCRIPKNLVELRQAFHAFPESAFDVSDQPSPVGKGGSLAVKELQAELQIAKQQIEIERLKRELAEEKLKRVTS